MNQKACAELHIPHYSPQTTGVWSLIIELASLYTVPLSAVNGSVVWLSLRRSQEQARPIRIRIESRSFAGP